MKEFLLITVLLSLVLFFASCNKLEQNDNPIPVWEDLGPDSVTVNATIQTVSGYLLPGQYVNFALSSDSLSKGILVRRVQTDGQGRASAHRLFPRNYFINCFATYQAKNYFGSFILFTKPSQRIDTLLLVY
jgi:hypothetical protein